ncbi:hypothetical protein BO78DRAFT_308806 [Aspergillus sclerotiicarbonarius CBS 121057]|uniref:Uncharacterized protein n=1 Tax=Aspergillus sclerotiicarbonarius (strain CBS 121057 / IBT 28362) TaxID=1448318 RepID=A0A319EWZ8_ASPSB|nr:hypothetical protein BO78DRAFT_308806 [Aspergillus sclerotiicarbonarius CBS 121057]
MDSVNLNNEHEAYEDPRSLYEIQAEVNAVLRNARIPCLVSGNMMKEILGYTTYVWHMDIILEDEDMGRAVKALREAGYNNHPKHVGCWYRNRFTDDFRRVPCNPAHVFHFQQRIWERRTRRFHLDLRLYRKSEYFWALPEIPLAGASENNRHYIWTDDPRLPRHHPEDRQSLGAFPYQMPPVMIPSPARVIEAVIRLKARDRKRPCRGRVWDLTLAHFMNVGTKEITPGGPSPIYGPLYDPDAFECIFREWWISELQADCIRSIDLPLQLEQRLECNELPEPHTAPADLT